ncbi:MAG: YkvA family protein [Pseudonocardia sp.]
MTRSFAPRFSPRRIAAFTALWRALRGAPGGPGLVTRLAAVPRMLRAGLTGRYPGLGTGRLALFALAVAYLVSPVDLVPELFLTLLGLTDDAVVALWLGGAFLAETDRFLGWERERPVVLDQLPEQGGREIG